MRYLSLALLLPVLSLGCDGGLKAFPTAKATGQVLCDGKPIENLRVYFRPLGQEKKAESGKVGEGQTAADGSFVISTYRTNDGAVTGKTQIIVDSPRRDDFPDFKCDCETHSNKWVEEVEVKARGDNHFIVNLKPRTKGSLPTISPKDLEDIKKSAETAAK